MPNKDNITQFPKNFFSNLKQYKPKVYKKNTDIPFKWSKNVLNGKSEVTIVAWNIQNKLS